MTLPPSRFYTGLVADLYTALRSMDPDPEPYARFIGRSGEPGLELGCGGGDPLLDLRRRGLEVEGLDASPDMLDLCRSRAAAAGIHVVLHESTIEAMDLGRRYRSIFLAGPTFNLLPDDGTAAEGLRRIAAHLEPGGGALVPLFVPEPVAPDDLGRPRRHNEGGGVVLQVTTVSSFRDEAARMQRTVLRYERIRDGAAEVEERDWLLHWHTQESFGAMATAAGLVATVVRDAAGGPTKPSSTSYVFVLEHPPARAA